MDQHLYQSSLEYHALKPAGKIGTNLTKDLSSQRHLSLAYSPGVAAPCEEIAKDPEKIVQYTNISNSVAVITNGTAVLGLGDIGPLAAKPVMEGKAALFKKFAGIDAIDIEIDTKNTKELINTITNIATTFGGINLEDIQAPECFEVERVLQSKLNIPVFHDDQHGTAIIVAAAITNALKIVNKKIDEISIVTFGAGAAAIPCLDILSTMGVKKENIVLVDSKGVVDNRRSDLNAEKSKYITTKHYHNLEESLHNKDIFLGVSRKNTLTAAMLKRMAPKPIVMALANPYPEIDPKLAHETRSDVIICTGRSDYPNQVNNVLCFPFIFRGALDVGAREINNEMKVACVKAIANLAMIESCDIVNNAYKNENLIFGDNYLLPKPLDPRLIMHVAPAVAKAAMESGIARRPIKDWHAYNTHLSQYVYQSALCMHDIFNKAKKYKRKIAYANSENENILRAAQIVSDEGIGFPIFIGNEQKILQKIKDINLRLYPGKNCQIYAEDKNNNRKAAQLVKDKFANCLLTILPKFEIYAELAKNIYTYLQDESALSTVTVIVIENKLFFISDGYLADNNSVASVQKQIVLALQTANEFNIEPNLAILSHRNIGHNDLNIQKVMELIRANNTNIKVQNMYVEDGLLGHYLQDSNIDYANIMIMPDMVSANAVINTIRHLAGAKTIGPIILGGKHSAHILMPTVSVRSMVNMSALAVVNSYQHNND